MGKKSTTTTQAPPQYIQDAQKSLISQAQGVASTPYQQYPGNMVAPFSPDQLAAFSNVNSSIGTGNQFLPQAYNLTTQAATPIAGQLPLGSSNTINALLGTAAQTYNNGTPNLYGDATGNYGNLFNQTTGGGISPGINQFLNPYTSNVLNSQIAYQNDQDAQQQNQLRGNAVASGAWGGDRAGVAAGVLGGQQALANNQVNSQTLSQAYQNSLGAFQQQQGLNQGLLNFGANTSATQGNLNLANAQGAQNAYAAQLSAAEQAASQSGLLNLYAGQQLQGLGTGAQQNSLAGSSAQLQSGALQQQLAQEGLNVPYQNFLQQLQYPYNQANFLAGILGGTAGLAGGSSTQPGPSLISQLGGLGVAGLGAYNAGLFGGGSGAIQQTASNMAGDTGQGILGALGFLARGGPVMGRPLGMEGAGRHDGLATDTPVYARGGRALGQIPGYAQSGAVLPIKDPGAPDFLDGIQQYAVPGGGASFVGEPWFLQPYQVPGPANLGSPNINTGGHAQGSSLADYLAANSPSTQPTASHSFTSLGGAGGLGASTQPPPLQSNDLLQSTGISSPPAAVSSPPLSPTQPTVGFTPPPVPQGTVSVIEPPDGQSTFTPTTMPPPPPRDGTVSVVEPPNGQSTFTPTTMPASPQQGTVSVIDPPNGQTTFGGGAGPSPITVTPMQTLPGADGDIAQTNDASWLDQLVGPQQTWGNSLISSAIGAATGVPGLGDVATAAAPGIGDVLGGAQQMSETPNPTANPFSWSPLSSAGGSLADLASYLGGTGNTDFGTSSAGKSTPSAIADVQAGLAQSALGNNQSPSYNPAADNSFGLMGGSIDEGNPWGFGEMDLMLPSKRGGAIGHYDSGGEVDGINFIDPRDAMFTATDPNATFQMRMMAHQWLVNHQNGTPPAQASAPPLGQSIAATSANVTGLGAVPQVGSAVPSAPPSAPSHRFHGHSLVAPNIAPSQVDLSGMGATPSLPTDDGSGSPTDTLSGLASDPNLALIAAGLGIAGGNSPFPLQNIGTGAMQGLNVLMKQRQEALEQKRYDTEAAYRQQTADREARQLDAEVNHWTRQDQNEAAYHTGLLNLRNQGQQKPLGFDAQGNPVFYNTVSGEDPGAAPVVAPINGRGRQPSPGSYISANTAARFAQADWNKYAKQDQTNGGTGVVYNQDGTVADKSKWMTDRTHMYMDMATAPGGPQPGQGAVTGPNPGQSGGSGSRMPPGETAQTLRAKAQAAIAQGKPRDAIIARLRQYGVDPSGL